MSEEFQLPAITWQRLQIDGSVRRVQLNRGPGEILFAGTSTPNRANQTLQFTSSAPATNGRAWQYESAPGIQTSGPNLAFDRALFGFIQTVEYFAPVAEYANRVRVYFGAEQARDSVTTSVPAPWFDREGALTGPVTPPHFAALASGADPHQIQIMDAPQAVFHAFRADSPIRRVALEGVFGVRLIAYDPALGLSVSTIAILFHARIRVALVFEQNQMDDPTLPLSWTKRGNLTVLSEGAGRGPGPIVLQGPLAKDQLAKPDATDNQKHFLQLADSGV